jgi:hypothetical protein
MPQGQFFLCSRPSKTFMAPVGLTGEDAAGLVLELKTFGDEPQAGQEGLGFFRAFHGSKPGNHHNVAGK